MAVDGVLDYGSRVDDVALGDLFVESDVALSDLLELECAGEGFSFCVAQRDNGFGSGLRFYLHWWRRLLDGFLVSGGYVGSDHDVSDGFVEHLVFLRDSLFYGWVIR